jgi:predicted phosphodiesterase
MPRKVNPYNLPYSDEETYKPYILPKKCRRVLVLPDVHVPYHNVPALTAAIDYGVKQKADTILINGDFLDCYSISSFEKDPRKRGFSDELKMGRSILNTLRTVFPKAHFIYQLGNHEDRYERFMKSKAPELLGIDEFEINNLLWADKYKMDVVRDKRYIEAGKLTIMHGHEISGASSNSPARGLYNKTKTPSLCGHHHQTGEHTERNVRGKVVTCWTMGCLSELTPAYRPINKYNHGFAFLTFKKDGFFEVFNKRVIDGQVV